MYYWGSKLVSLVVLRLYCLKGLVVHVGFLLVLDSFLWLGDVESLGLDSFWWSGDVESSGLDCSVLFIVLGCTCVKVGLLVC